MSQTPNTAIAVVGIDIGKNSFHVVGHDARGAIVLRQKWSRGQVEARLANMPPCLIGMEACVGAHHLSRKLASLGHAARLMPAKYVLRARRRSRGLWRTQLLDDTQHAWRQSRSRTRCSACRIWLMMPVRCDRARQQACPHRLGGAGQRTRLRVDEDRRCRRRPTRLILAPCSARSRRSLATPEPAASQARRPALTAPARDAIDVLRAGTKERP
jgi:hypothetical protein